MTPRLVPSKLPRAPGELLHVDGMDLPAVAVTITEGLEGPVVSVEPLGVQTNDGEPPPFLEPPHGHRA